MKAGVSSASLYPLHTEDAVREIAELGVKNMEIFINDISETKGEIFEDICRIKEIYGINVLSLHPFSSPMETLFLFSDYDRRRSTFFDMYRRYFESMNRLGAEIFVLHGAILSAGCSDEHYIEQYLKLCDVATEYGVTVVQENISYCKSKDIAFLQRMKRECGGRAKFVLDIKQAVRSKLSPIDIIDALGDSIIHVHISDNKEGADCLPVGEGDFDFRRLISSLKSISYKGGLMIELYRRNFREPKELYDSMKKIEEILQEE